jgi:hypothetical protein
MRALTSLLALALVVLLGGCIDARYPATLAVAPAPGSEQVYAALYPYYVEFCAVSEIRKKPGSAVDIEGGGPGGHSVLYLNGVCKGDAAYPEIRLCDGDVADQGVGISVNAHYRNANWSAISGRDFFFHGALAPGEPVNAVSYARTQARAKAQGALDGIVFHDAVMRDKPKGMSDRDYKYELSIATDYAIGFGRDRYCARVPLNREKMGNVVEYLNSVNQPYRFGLKSFEWDVLRDNCAHLTHNALAVVGLWRHWPTDRSLLVAAFDFPVPKNEFVNLMRRVNELPIDDPESLWSDREQRDALTIQNWIATRPGGLAEAERVVRDNTMYETDLRLIFFDEAITGAYRRHFDEIFTTPRTTDLRSNFDYFMTLYDRILSAKPPSGFDTGERAAFLAAYYDRIRAERSALEASRARLSLLGH